ncbi:ERMES complex subunit mmm1 [Entophlyctis luteolus]|nr:ERMES complex subunit mmm1 [Entophlyctis luteolus]
MVKWIDAKLNAGISGANSQPSFLGPVTITDFSLGEEYMKFANARIRYAEQSSNLRAEVEFEYNDQITIGVDTQVILNWPKPAIASLPVSLVLSVVRFSGTLGVEFVSLPDSSETFFAVSVLPPVALEFDVRSLLGHRTKVKDLPKLTALITSQLRTAFVDEIVWPSFKRIPVPILFSDHGSGAVVPEMPAAATAALVPDGALPADVGSGESKDR